MPARAQLPSPGLETGGLRTSACTRSKLSIRRDGKLLGLRRRGRRGARRAVRHGRARADGARRRRRELALPPVADAPSLARRKGRPRAGRAADDPLHRAVHRLDGHLRHAAARVPAREARHLRGLLHVPHVRAQDDLRPRPRRQQLPLQRRPGKRVGRGGVQVADGAGVWARGRLRRRERRAHGAEEVRQGRPQHDRAQGLRRLLRRGDPQLLRRQVAAGGQAADGQGLRRPGPAHHLHGQPVPLWQGDQGPDGLADRPAVPRPRRRLHPRQLPLRVAPPALVLQARRRAHGAAQALHVHPPRAQGGHLGAGALRHAEPSDGRQVQVGRAHERDRRGVLHDRDPDGRLPHLVRDLGLDAHAHRPEPRDPGGPDPGAVRGAHGQARHQARGPAGDGLRVAEEDGAPGRVPEGNPPHPPAHHRNHAQGDPRRAVQGLRHPRRQLRLRLARRGPARRAQLPQPVQVRPLPVLQEGRVRVERVGLRGFRRGGKERKEQLPPLRRRPPPLHRRILRLRSDQVHHRHPPAHAQAVAAEGPQDGRGGLPHAGFCQAVCAAHGRVRGGVRAPVGGRGTVIPLEMPG